MAMNFLNNISALLILVAILGDGQETLLCPVRCGCFALLLDQLCCRRQGQGGEETEPRAHTL